MILFIYELIMFVTLVFSQSINKKIFTFDTTLYNPNREIFVREFGQSYICPFKSGWNIDSQILARNLQDNNTLLFTEYTECGLYQLNCGKHTIVIEIIDSQIFDIIIHPSFPPILNRGQSYFFNVLLQPLSLMDDRTYIWNIYQNDGFDKLDFQKRNNIFTLNINKSVTLGNYSFYITLDFKEKYIYFCIIKEIIRKTDHMHLPIAFDSVDSATNLNRYFLTFLVIGFLVIIISTFVYICAILCTRRKPITDITGHKNLQIEEECLMDEEAKQCYKIMSNPMNREKDVELILEKAREMGKNMLPLSRGRCGLTKEDSSQFSMDSFENNPYGVSPETIRYLRSKFSKGVCLNCVKLASQMILLNKMDCPSIHHVCKDKNCLNHGKALRCLCAEMQINETAVRTNALYENATTALPRCQIQNYNSSNADYYFYDEIYHEFNKK